ncbi:Uncharacterized protein Fot_41277 [Forsythia ovata]|uniref:Uncharacterized protein n=1 Tax=Forsythia ovata TaxID=205694 RepID=A0ABD1RHV6_9LAMI
MLLNLSATAASPIAIGATGRRSVINRYYGPANYVSPQEKVSKAKPPHLCQRLLDQAGCKSRDVHEWQGPEGENQQANLEDKPPQYFSENLPHTKIEPADAIQVQRTEVNRAESIKASPTPAACTTTSATNRDCRALISFSNRDYRLTSPNFPIAVGLVESEIRDCRALISQIEASI